MKTTVPVGKESEEAEVRVKEYSGGAMIIETGDSKTFIKNKQLIKESKVKIDEREKKSIMSKPNDYKMDKGKLVKKVKKQ